MGFKEFSKNYFSESKDTVESYLTETLITFGKKAYPKFGHIVILAGGAGSGKGFLQSNILGIEGKVFDVDALKLMVKKLTKYDVSKIVARGLKSNLIDSKIKEKIGDISHINLKDPKDVGKLHFIVKSVGVEKMQKKTIADAIALADPDRKPNLIFDVTLKDPKKLVQITDMASSMGYDKKNIHIVWALNDIDIAMEQNKGRARVVPENVLVDTHEGASKVMNDLIKSGNGVRKYMDGKIVIAFMRKDKDSTVYVSNPEMKAKQFEIAKALGIKKLPKFEKFKLPVTIKKAFYVVVKEVGKPVEPFGDVVKKVLRKMMSFMKKADIDRTNYWVEIANDTKKWLDAISKGKLSADDEKNKLLKYIKDNGIM